MRTGSRIGTVIFALIYYEHTMTAPSFLAIVMVSPCIRLLYSDTGALCFSPSSLQGHAGVDEEGHLRVLLLKAIASLFISGFVTKRRPRPVSGAYTSMVAGGGQATVRCCVSLVPPSFTLCVRFH